MLILKLRENKSAFFLVLIAEWKWKAYEKSVMTNMDADINLLIFIIISIALSLDNNQMKSICVF